MLQESATEKWWIWTLVDYHLGTTSKPNNQVVHQLVRLSMCVSRFVNNQLWIGTGRADIETYVFTNPGID